MTKKVVRKKMRRWKKILLTLTTLVMVAVIGGGTFLFYQLGKIKDTDTSKKNIAVNEELDKGSVKGYKTIALFGLDSRDISNLGEGNNSDTIIIASINEDTKEVKLASVYRDTYMQMTDGSYNKVNSAYCSGGPTEAISVLNTNLDLNISEYVTINFMALVDVIDQLGGIEVNIEESELIDLNNYILSVSEITGVDSDPVASSGLQTLSGVQATAYCRIRYGGGDDYKRTERQRLVISKIIEKAKKSNVTDITKIIGSVTEEVQSNISTTNILAMGVEGMGYELGETAGFPFTKVALKEGVSVKDSVIACGMSYNVEELHKFLYGENKYQISSVVEKTSNAIQMESGIETKEIEE